MTRSKEERAPADTLSQQDLLRMLLNQANVQVEILRLALIRKSLAYQKVSSELDAARLEAQTQRNLAHLTGEAQQADKKLNIVQEEARILAEEIAQRYAVDWKQASYDPLTGAIVRHPGDV